MAQAPSQTSIHSADVTAHLHVVGYWKMSKAYYPHYMGNKKGSHEYIYF